MVQNSSYKNFLLSLTLLKTGLTWLKGLYLVERLTFVVVVVVLLLLLFCFWNRVCPVALAILELYVVPGCPHKNPPASTAWVLGLHIVKVLLISYFSTCDFCGILYAIWKILIIMNFIIFPFWHLLYIIFKMSLTNETTTLFQKI